MRASSRRPRPSRAATGAPTDGNTYLYGIVRAPVPKDLKSLGTGVGEPPRQVHAITYEGLGAIVSDLPADDISAQGVRGMRRDMKAHAALLNRAMERVTVLPVRFGVVLPSPAALISRVLEPQYRRIQAYLAQLDGALEVTL